MILTLIMSTCSPLLASKFLCIIILAKKSADDDQCLFVRTVCALCRRGECLQLISNHSMSKILKVPIPTPTIPITLTAPHDNDSQHDKDDGKTTLA